MRENKDMNKLICAVLYGCEGAKYPASNKIAFTNSDDQLICTFVNLIRRSFVLDESKWRVHLQIHTDQDYPELIKFWSSLLKIDSNKFIKPTITSPNGKKHRNIYKGTCTVRYYDYRLQLKLIGIFGEFMRKSALQGGVG
jgi:hypothetical protein